MRTEVCRARHFLSAIVRVKSQLWESVLTKIENITQV